MIYFKTFIQMVIQDLSVLHAVVYTFARRMLGSFFWFSKVLTFILVLPPSEDPLAHKRWVDQNLSAAWNVAGPQNRVGYVSYIGGVPSDRLGSINVTPPTLFGNYSSSQVLKSKQKTFAMHEHGVLGGTPIYAERIGREIISNFWNSLQFCDLELDQNIDELMSKISFKDPEMNSLVKLRPLPFNPQHNRDGIEHYLRLYAWHKWEAALFRVNISKARLLDNRNKKKHPAGSIMVQDVRLWSHHLQQPVEPDSGTETSFNIEKVLGKIIKNGKLHYVVQIKDVEQSMEIEENSSRYAISTFHISKSDNKLSIKGNAILLEYLKNDMLSRVPNHPALGLLVQNEQRSSTAEQDSTQAILSGEEDLTWAIHSREEDPTQARAENQRQGSSAAEEDSTQAIQSGEEDSTSARVEKRKTPSSEEPDTYEVEEILGHRCDSQACI